MLVEFIDREYNVLITFLLHTPQTVTIGHNCNIIEFGDNYVIIWIILNNLIKNKFLGLQNFYFPNFFIS